MLLYFNGFAEEGILAGVSCNAGDWKASLATEIHIFMPLLKVKEPYTILSPSIIHNAAMQWKHTTCNGRVEATRRSNQGNGTFLPLFLCRFLLACISITGRFPRRVRSQSRMNFQEQDLMPVFPPSSLLPAYLTAIHLFYSKRYFYICLCGWNDWI